MKRLLACLLVVGVIGCGGASETPPIPIEHADSATRVSAGRVARTIVHANPYILKSNLLERNETPCINNEPNGRVVATCET